MLLYFQMNSFKNFLMLNNFFISIMYQDIFKFVANSKIPFDSSKSYLLALKEALHHISTLISVIGNRKLVSQKPKTIHVPRLSNC